MSNNKTSLNTCWVLSLYFYSKEASWNGSLNWPTFNPCLFSVAYRNITLTTGLLHRDCFSGMIVTYYQSCRAVLWPELLAGSQKLWHCSFVVAGMGHSAPLSCFWTVIWVQKSPSLYFKVVVSTNDILYGSVLWTLAMATLGEGVAITPGSLHCAGGELCFAFFSWRRCWRMLYPGVSLGAVVASSGLWWWSKRIRASLALR